MASLIPIKPSVKGGLVLDASNKPVATPNLTVQAAAGAAGDDFPNPSGRTYLILFNTTTPAVPPATPVADQIATISPQGKPAGLVIAPYDVAVPAGCFVTVGPFDTNLFNSSGGAVQVAAKTGSTAIKVAVLQV